jgi:hypothetical protein
MTVYPTPVVLKGYTLVKTTKTRPLPALTIPTLLTLSLPGARLLLSDGECYVLTRRSPKCLTSKVYDALRSADWITTPEERGAGIAECLLTTEGKRLAEKIKSERSAYCQPLLF